MKRIVLLASIIGLACTLMIFCAYPTIFACSGCGNDTEVEANEQSKISCFICAKEITNKDTPLEVEYRGIIFCFCSESCLNTFNRDPAKCIRRKILQQK